MLRPLPLLLALAVVLLWLASALFYVVDETQQALVVRLGAPVRVVREPGLRMKLPFVDSVLIYDARLLPIELPAEQVILGDQKRLEVQPYARYLIASPLKFNQALQTQEQAADQIGQMVSSSLRRELGRVALPVLLSPQRSEVVARIQREVAERARPLGIEVTEVRFHRADLPLETSQAIYDRMKSERQREAKELRAQGSEWAQQIEARADRDRTVIVSEAQKAARITRGEGDAEASAILNRAFAADPPFYRYYRALQTYRQALADAHATVVLSPDMAFLHDLKAGPPAAAATPSARR
ncbi:MAG: protease modulator HflC [Proteobacteria bacterium]|nr:protease modulator HflC [Pseudomonadota bacterium]